MHFNTKAWITLAFLVSAQLLSAQQLDYTSLYRFNWQVLNPAAVNHVYLSDHNKQYFFNASYRQQWSGFDGSPANYNVRFEYLPQDDNIKLGAFAVGDQAGAIGTYTFGGNFSYLIYFNKGVHSRSYLSVGLNMAGVSYNIDMNEIRFQDNQPNLPADAVLNQAYADMALGCFYRWSKVSFTMFDPITVREFYAGISVPQTFTMDLSQPEEGDFDLKRVQHFYLITGAKLNFTEDIFIEPSLWTRYVPESSFQTLFNNTPLSADLNCRLVYADRYWLGAGAGTNRLLHFEGGVNVGQGQYLNSHSGYQITIAAAYDQPVGWQRWLGPSFELSLAVGWE